MAFKKWMKIWCFRQISNFLGYGWFFFTIIFVISRVFGKLCPKICFCVHVSLKRLANDRFDIEKNEKYWNIRGGRSKIYRFFLLKSKEIGWVGVRNVFADFFSVCYANFANFGGSHLSNEKKAFWVLWKVPGYLNDEFQYILNLRNSKILTLDPPPFRVKL